MLLSVDGRLTYPIGIESLRRVGISVLYGRFLLGQAICQWKSVLQCWGMDNEKR